MFIFKEIEKELGEWRDEFGDIGRDEYVDFGKELVFYIRVNRINIY